MEKILIAHSARRFPEAAFKFVQQLHYRKPLQVVDFAIPQYEVAPSRLFCDPVSIFAELPVVSADDAEVAVQNIMRFKRICGQEDILCTIHNEATAISGDRIQQESRFADLMVIDSDHFYEHMEEGDLYYSLMLAIQKAECPVLMIPNNASLPDQTILAYDGSPSSVFAIRQFAQLFPELCGNRTFLVYAGDNKSSSMPFEENIKELAGQLFSDLTILHLHQNAKKYFANWLGSGRNAILVSGAFGRSSISQIFRKSFAAPLIKDLRLPVFIAHR
jgi:hypothetical protein